MGGGLVTAVSASLGGDVADLSHYFHGVLYPDSEFRVATNLRIADFRYYNSASSLIVWDNTVLNVGSTLTVDTGGQLGGYGSPVAPQFAIEPGGVVYGLLTLQGNVTSRGQL